MVTEIRTFYNLNNGHGDLKNSGSKKKYLTSRLPIIKWKRIHFNKLHMLTTNLNFHIVWFYLTWTCYHYRGIYVTPFQPCLFNSSSNKSIKGPGRSLMWNLKTSSNEVEIFRYIYYGFSRFTMCIWKFIIEKI